jgi:hypothetical protein
MSSLSLKSFSVSAMRSGRKSNALRGGGIRPRFEADSESTERLGGSVDDTERSEVPVAFCLRVGGNSMQRTTFALESMTGIKS